VVWLPSNDFIQGLITGASIALISAMLAFAFLVSTNNVPRLVGAWGEDSTDAELKAAAKAGLVHGYVAHIRLHGFDIDAVAVTSAGVLGIETKWHSAAPITGQLRRDAASARSGEQHTRSVLRAIGAAQVPVQPLLAIWGPHRDQLPPGLVVDGVPVVAGDQLGEWMREHAQSGSLDVAAGRRLSEALEQFARSHGPHAVNASASDLRR
jgi:hypothetical protein